MEPTIVVDKYAVCVEKNNIIVGHLLLGKSERFAKTMCYFLRADSYAECNVKITRKAVNLGDGEGIKVLCLLHIVGREDMFFLNKTNGRFLRLVKTINESFKENFSKIRI